MNHEGPPRPSPVDMVAGMIWKRRGDTEKVPSAEATGTVWYSTTATTEDQTAVENAAGAHHGGPVLDPHTVETEIGEVEVEVEVAAANGVGADNVLCVHVMPDAAGYVTPRWRAVTIKALFWFTARVSCSCLSGLALQLRSQRPRSCELNGRSLTDLSNYFNTLAGLGL